MITTTDTAERSEHAAAFQPSHAGSRPVPKRAPGWDFGPERRIGDGHGLARAVAGFGIVIAAVAAVAWFNASHFGGGGR